MKLRRTLLTAAAAASAALALGLPTAWFIATRPARSRPLWLFLITIPFWTNLLIRTFAILEVIRNEGLINTVLLSLGVPLSLFTVIIGQVLITTPFAVAILTSAFQSLDRSLEEAAMDLGETAWSTFRLIVLPLVMPGILASFLICFTISFDEFIISNFLGSGQPILSVYILGQFRFPAKVPSMLALGTVLVCFSIILLGFAEYMRRRGIAKAGGKDSGGFL